MEVTRLKVDGVLDWMFPVKLARQAQTALSSASAALTYHEVDSLSHCYARELNRALLGWMEATPKKDDPATAGSHQKHQQSG